MERLEYEGFEFFVGENMYYPREDTFFLLEEVMKLRGSLLEIGIGCGIISILYEKKKGEYVEGVDVCKEAVEIAKKNANINGSRAVFYESRMFSKVKNKFENVVFNPPYLSKLGEEGEGDETYLYDKGQIEEFITKAKEYGSNILILLSDANERFGEYMEKLEKNYEIEYKKSKRFFFEKLWCIKAKA